MKLTGDVFPAVAAGVFSPGAAAALVSLINRHSRVEWWIQFYDLVRLCLVGRHDATKGATQSSPLPLLCLPINKRRGCNWGAKYHCFFTNHSPSLSVGDNYFYGFLLLVSVIVRVVSSDSIDFSSDYMYIYNTVQYMLGCAR